MVEIAYPRERTAFLLVDPYNDFLSEGGKSYPRLKPIAPMRVGLLDIICAGWTAPYGRRASKWSSCRTGGGSQVTMRTGTIRTPRSNGSMQGHHFARGEWGGDWHPDLRASKPGDIVAQEHWGQSGFANTDLDFRLKQKGITHVIVVGLLANTCIEFTARFAMELGYHVTLVRDATAAFSHEMMHAAHELNGPAFAHAILTTAELIAALAKGVLIKGRKAITRLSIRLPQLRCQCR